jgi:hypothetical protein
MSQYLLERRRKMLGIKPAEEKKEVKKPINKQSEKRKVEQKKYRKIVTEMMAVSDRCEIKQEGCTGKATGLHHKQKRTPKNFLQKTNLLRSCDNCNTWVENNPEEAMEKGFSISKHKKQN